MNYKEFFQPSNKVKTLTNIGCDNLLGIRRTPFFTAAPCILKEVRLIAWRAVQHWETSARVARFGENFHPKTRLKSCWTPDSVVWLYITMEKNKQDKLASSRVQGDNSVTTNSTTVVSSSDSSNSLMHNFPTKIIASGDGNSVSEQHANDSSVIFVSSVVSSSSSSAGCASKNKNTHINHTNSSACAAIIKCFYGHKTSSSTDIQGREQWRFSPTPPWPGVPPARPLCQRCYLYHRASFLRGESQYEFPHLYVTKQVKVSTVRPPEAGGASSSSSITRPPD